MAKEHILLSSITVLIPLLVCLIKAKAIIDPSGIKILPVKEQVLWMQGLEDVAEYRIPVITSTVSGYLIAAVEARKYSSGDASPKFLAVRRSKDGGKNWEPQRFLLNDGIYIKDGINLGAIVTDRVTGTVFINYLTCGHFTDKNCTTPSVHMINSTDEGNTWNMPPVNISTQIGTTSFASGPGYGVQKQYTPYVGRLILCGHVSHGGSRCILSDDHGKTWRYGTQGLNAIPSHQTKKAGDFELNECQPVELPDGSIMLNARNEYNYHCKCRGVARSYDGADTFPMEYVSFDETLIDPVVAAGLLYHNGIMFFTNPKSSTRQNLVLRWSFSNGTKWDDEYTIWPKLAAYSTMTAIPGFFKWEKYIYILYEKGVTKSYESISLVVVSLDGTF